MGAGDPSPLRGGWPEGPGGVASAQLFTSTNVEHCRTNPTRPLRGHPPLKGEGTHG